jgi:hypothetical protein
MLKKAQREYFAFCAAKAAALSSDSCTAILIYGKHHDLNESLLKSNAADGKEIGLLEITLKSEPSDEAMAELVKNL